ncbi:MAG: hypothetical protein RLZZ116_1555 [Planctomycetota bacterium]|jgi:uncharacterized Tic20 family protein
MTDVHGTSGTSGEWYWSQRGATLGPVAFDEIRRLAASGSILPDTWLFDPAQRNWVAASSIAGLFPAGGSDSPPDVPPPPSPQSVVYCRFCGATNSPFAARCASCGREAGGSAAASSIDPKLAAVFCRVSVLAAPLLSTIIVGPAIAPAIVWALGANDPRVVAEAKETFNCLLTVLIVSAACSAFGLIGAILIVPAILAGIALAAVAIYCIVVGIMGLVALSSEKPFRYPWILRLIK